MNNERDRRLMDREKVLDEIFANDPFGLLNVKAKNSNVKTGEQRLVDSFEEINDFVVKNSREPSASQESVGEYQLYARLKNLREDLTKIKVLKEYDFLKLLPDIDKPKQSTVKEINSLDDIFANDSLNILGDDDAAGLFEFKHVPKISERESADFVARRKPCKDFDKYEIGFKEVQNDLANGKRSLIKFKMGELREGEYYVHNGLLFLLETIAITKKDHYREDGTRVREDGRTRCIFENGTESNMLKRSVEKILYSNGKVVSQNIDKVNQGFEEHFSAITDQDEDSGYIYVLKSKSTDERIRTIKDLYKIGYSKTDVEERIKDAEKEATYLMAPVRIVGAWKCYNMNPQKLEQLLHRFFGNSCLNIDVFDENGKRHSPREWFIAPLDVIEQAIELIVSGKIVDYRFDADNLTIVNRY